MLCRRLTAEDGALSAPLLRRAVEALCDTIITVTNGFDAGETCHNNPNINLILIDIKMPGMDGYEATKQIRQFNKTTVIIAQTACSLAYNRQNAIEAGCDDYISKPYNRYLIIALIEKCLEKMMKNL